MDGLIVRNYDDLNIKIDYINKSRKKVLCYSELSCHGKSTFGNCYFELFKLDSTESYRNITQDVIARGDMAKDFKDREEILKYDIKKTPLDPGDKRSFTFNILDCMGEMTNGKYSLVIYLRSANNYGFDNQQQVVRNSITWLESVNINFDVIRDENKDGILRQNRK